MCDTEENLSNISAIIFTFIEDKCSRRKISFDGEFDLD